MIMENWEMLTGREGEGISDPIATFSRLQIPHGLPWGQHLASVVRNWLLPKVK
jgi:hypothetical protein